MGLWSLSPAGLGFLGTGMMVENLRQVGNPGRCLQGGVKDVGEHWRQLVSTVLEGGRRDRVRPSCFAGVLPLEKSVNFTLLNGESCHSRGGRGEATWMGRDGSGLSNCLSNLQ